MATAAQIKRRNENQKYLENKYVRAALEMISKAEGTNGDYKRMVFGVVTSSPLYPSLIGKKNVRIPALDRYPRIMVRVNKNLSSSAAGKYQILRKTYDGAAAKMGLTDFSENTQDLLAVELMRQRGVIPYLLKGDIQGALTKTTFNKEWASLAGAGYGQKEYSIANLKNWFNSALGKTAEFVAENPETVAGGGAIGLAVVAVLVFF